MTYEEAIKKSLEVEWEISTCSEGEICWCRTIRCNPPVMFMDGDSLTEYYPIRAGEVGKETVKHLVKIHNNYLKSSK